jgi:hypothetical protein
MSSAKSPSRFRRWLDRVAARVGRSAGAFLFVLVVLCAIEVAVDWNATLTEVNVLRATLRQKGENYADLLRKAAEGAVLGYDWDELDRLSAALFDDDEVVYVRFADLLGNTIYDRLRPEHARAFSSAHAGTSFRAHYRRVFQRDIGGMLKDPLRLKANMERSRHTDFFQAFTDAQNRFVAWITSSPMVAPKDRPRVLYQDRLADENGRLDRDLTYALGAVTNDAGEGYGVVVVAFQNDALNAKIRGKLRKGLAITVFFVALILVQNVVGRKSKLRLAALEEALKAAREAVRAALPTEIPPLPGRATAFAFAQSERLGGTIFDARAVGTELEIFVAVPEGHGVDAAFASAALLEIARRAPAGDDGEPAARAEAILSAYARSRLARPMALLLLRVDASGRARGVVSRIAAPCRAVDGRALPVAVGAAPVVLSPEAASLLRAPLVSFADDGTAPLVLWDDGEPPSEPGAPRRYDGAAAIAAALAAEPAGGAGRADRAVDEVMKRAVKRGGKRRLDDLLAIVV